jgi:hypothetical protein
MDILVSCVRIAVLEEALVVVVIVTVAVRLELTVTIERETVHVLMDTRVKTVVMYVIKTPLALAVRESVCVRTVLNVTDSQVT